MENDTKTTADDPYVSAVKRLDVIFSAANDYEEGARKMRDEFVVTPRSELPEVVEEGGDFLIDGVLFLSDDSRERVRAIALRYLAMAEYLEAKEARKAEAAKEAELTARRDALANELYLASVFAGRRDYARSHMLVVSAVDRLIKAEDKLAKFKAQA